MTSISGPSIYDTLKADGFWDYSFVDRSSEVKINIIWDKKEKTLSEDLIPMSIQIIIFIFIPSPPACGGRGLG